MLQYADRAFISINGAEISDLQSFSLKQNENAREVGTMSRNRRNKGIVVGNKTIDISMTTATQNLAPRPKLESIDYANNSVQIGVEIGGNLFTVTGVFLKDTDDSTGGVGDEAKASRNFGALDIIDAVGNTVDFDVSL